MGGVAAAALNLLGRVYALCQNVREATELPHRRASAPVRRASNVSKSFFNSSHCYNLQKGGPVQRQLQHETPVIIATTSAPAGDVVA